MLLQLYIQLGRSTKVLGNIKIPPPLNSTFNWGRSTKVLGNIKIYIQLLLMMMMLMMMMRCPSSLRFGAKPRHLPYIYIYIYIYIYLWAYIYKYTYTCIYIYIYIYICIRISRKVAPEGLPWVLLYEVKGRAASPVTWLFRRLLVILVPPPTPPSTPPTHPKSRHKTL